MSKTQYFTATSLDGFIADENNSLDWLFAVGHGEDNTNESMAFFRELGAFCMGRNTYEWILKNENMLSEPAKWQKYHGDIPCWVFTHGQPPMIPGANIRFVSADIRQVHGEMVNAAAGKNIWVAGGGDLAGQFADAGMLDELVLSIAPVTLGRGAPLLPRRITAECLKLESAEKRGAFVQLRYSLMAKS